METLDQEEEPVGPGQRKPDTKREGGAGRETTPEMTPAAAPGGCTVGPGGGEAISHKRLKPPEEPASKPGWCVRNKLWHFGS